MRPARAEDVQVCKVRGSDCDEVPQGAQIGLEPHGTAVPADAERDLGVNTGSQFAPEVDLVLAGPAFLEDTCGQGPGRGPVRSCEET